MAVLPLLFQKSGSTPVVHLTPFRRDHFENKVDAREVEKLLDVMDLKLYWDSLRDLCIYRITLD
jgi:hypothetical protein